jgi:hypothetical protein
VRISHYTAAIQKGMGMITLPCPAARRRQTAVMAKAQAPTCIVRTLDCRKILRPIPTCTKTDGYNVRGLYYYHILQKTGASGNACCLLSFNHSPPVNLLPHDLQLTGYATSHTCEATVATKNSGLRRGRSATRVDRRCKIVGYYVTRCDRRFWDD